MDRSLIYRALNEVVQFDTHGDSESEDENGSFEIDECKGDDMLNEICKLLDSSHQVILTGAPGTGKTYLAKKVALAAWQEVYAGELGRGF